MARNKTSRFAGIIGDIQQIGIEEAHKEHIVHDEPEVHNESMTHNEPVKDEVQAPEIEVQATIAEEEIKPVQNAEEEVTEDVVPETIEVDPVPTIEGGVGEADQEDRLLDGNVVVGFLFDEVENINVYGKTQGKTGKKLQKIGISFTKENRKFLEEESKRQWNLPISELINNMLEALDYSKFEYRLDYTVVQSEAVRMNMGFSSRNYHIVKVGSRRNGITPSEFINQVVEAERKKYEKQHA